jgi:cell division protein FtsW
MKTLLKNIKGDKQLWVFVSLLMLFSIMVVYSASSNLVNTYGTISSWQFIVKHLILLGMGFVVMYTVHLLKERAFLVLSHLGIYFVIILLAYTLSRGFTMGGANASRWIFIPVVGSFQPSTLAFLVLMMFTARFLGRKNGAEMTFAQALKKYWIYVFAIVGLILPANLSTAVLIFLTTLIILFIGGYPFKDLLKIIGLSLVGLVFIILLFKAFPNSISNRLDTWQARLERYFENEDNASDKIIITDKNYQEVHAKIAIAKGGLVGLNPGKSTEKYFLPQSVSDFIYAIIIEEYGLVGGLIILFIYLFIGLRIFIISKNQQDKYYKILVLAVGLPLLFQALINMGVAVGLLPVTGQPLPLLSSGGTAILITTAAFGIILAADRIRTEKQQQELDDYISD